MAPKRQLEQLNSSNPGKGGNIRSQEEIAALKRQRLGGLNDFGAPRQVQDKAGPSANRPSLLAPPAPSKGTSSTSSESTTSSSSSDEELEQITAEVAQQPGPSNPTEPTVEYARVKAKTIANRGGITWTPLIPSQTNPYQEPRKKKRKLKKDPKDFQPFGAHYLDQISAAKAADRALIAMWGPDPAISQLNFPIETYPAVERQRRYGHELSSFLLEICKEASVSRELVKKQRVAKSALTGKFLQEHADRYRKIQAVKEAGLVVDDKKKCGICPSCRDPWGNESCYLAQDAKKLGYKGNQMAEAMLDEAGGDLAALGIVEDDLDEEESEKESEGADKETAGGGVAQGEKKGAGETMGRGRGKKGAAGAAAEKKASLLPPLELQWHGAPPKGVFGSLRRKHENELESLYLHAEAAAGEEAAAEAAALMSALEAARHPGLSRAFPPKDFIPAPPQGELLRHAAECASVGADLALFHQDEHKVVMNSDAGGVVQCTMCYREFHGSAAKDCPMIKAAYASAAPLFEPCENCEDEKVQGCKECGRGNLPANVWTPAVKPVEWLDRVNPGTADVMESVQKLASAAAVDFDRPEVAQNLGPDALLALGLLTEEVTAAQLRGRQTQF